MNDLTQDNDPNKKPLVIIKTEEQKQIEKQNQEEKFNSDYEFSREKLKNLAEMGEEALEKFKEVALESEEPGMYRAFGELLKNVSDVVTQIMDTSTKKAEIDKHQNISMPKDPEQIPVFYGTPRDLLAKTKNDELPVIDVE